MTGDSSVAVQTRVGVVEAMRCLRASTTIAAWGLDPGGLAGPPREFQILITDVGTFAVVSDESAATVKVQQIGTDSFAALMLGKR